MLHLHSSTVYYWYHGAVNMRSSFDALCGLVNQYCQTTILQGGVYIFVNKKRNQIKLLTWEGDGLAIYYKRLEKGVYELPAIEAISKLTIIEKQSSMIVQLQAKVQQQEKTNQDLQFQLAQLKKLVFGSRHEKFVATDTPLAPTLFDIPVIPALLAPTVVSYEKSGKQARHNHPGRNSYQ